ncbi:hypothetical protein ONZ45_g12782 [Pleurotus djamor]|nr:hypothetical protein ONZ45_g12782 [Pleurotus djamor]
MNPLPPPSINSELSSTLLDPPSLVSQLQRVHGLTKRKLRGANPARQPFFREKSPMTVSPWPLPLHNPNLWIPQTQLGNAASATFLNCLERGRQTEGISPGVTDLRFHPYNEKRRSRRRPGQEYSRRTSYSSSSTETQISTEMKHRPASHSSVCDEYIPTYQVVPGPEVARNGSTDDGGVIPPPPWLQPQYALDKLHDAPDNKRFNKDVTPPFVGHLLYPNTLIINPSVPPNTLFLEHSPVVPPHEMVLSTTCQPPTISPPNREVQAKSAAPLNTHTDYHLDALPYFPPSVGDEPFFIAEVLTQKQPSVQVESTRVCISTTPNDTNVTSGLAISPSGLQREIQHKSHLFPNQPMSYGSNCLTHAFRVQNDIMSAIVSQHGGLYARDTSDNDDQPSAMQSVTPFLPRDSSSSLAGWAG